MRTLSLFFLCFCLHTTNVYTQEISADKPPERLIIEMYADGGHNQTYSGFSQLSPNIIVNAGQKTRLQLGSNFLFSNNAHKTFNAFGFSIQHQIFEKEHKKLSASAGHLHILPTENFRDNYYFVRLEYTTLRWKFQLGNNRRETKLSKYALENQVFTGDNTKITDNRNFIYHLGWWIKPIDNQWNIQIAATNFDRYLLDIETNPSFIVLGEYKTGKKINYFVQLNFRTAGSMNLAANYYSILIRGGVTWNVL